MKGEWCYFKSRFNPEQCQRIIDDASTIAAQDSYIGTNEGMKTDLSYRRSKVKFISNQDWKFQWLFDDLWKMAIQANHDFFDVHITRLSFIQLAEYDYLDHGEYKDHHDVFWITNDVVHRKITCVIQLTDPRDYDGGELQLLDTGQFPPAEDLRQQGTALFFPSFFMHRATPVTRGKRYSIAAWFEGPKWR